ncbi:glutathione S-transferase family protein, partial [Henriciella sp.]|uniref:glutathione S-transferase family protein n=1 Tax=Henriciella sp. TaxID=1968823 RepID=UPI0017FEEE4C
MKPTLYHCRNARSFRPLWALEELGIDYDLVVLPFPPRVHYKQYLDINPLGTIPFFTDGKTKMTESTGICHYLAETHGPTDLAVRPDEAGYGEYLNWMYFSDATLTFPQTLVLRYEMLEKKSRRQPQVADDYRMWFAGRLRVVDQKLEHSKFMVADRFTMADIAIGPNIRYQQRNF